MELKCIIEDGGMNERQYEFVFEMENDGYECRYSCLVIYHNLEYKLRFYGMMFSSFNNCQIELKDVPENVLKVYRDIVSDPLFEIEYERFKGI